MNETIYTKLGKGPNLVLLHGWGQDRHTWDGVMEQLKDEFTCWALDLPGFGQNPRPKETWNPRNYAEWLGQFMIENNIEAPTVIGHSFGGRVAIELGGTPHPNPLLKEARGENTDSSKTPLRSGEWVPNMAGEVVSKLVLYATPGFREPISRFTSMAQALARGLKSARVPLHKIPGVSQIKKRLQSPDDSSANEMRDIFRASIEYDLTRAMSNIENPVLLLWGEEDTEVPLIIARAMQETIAGAELKTIPHASHFAHLEQPGLFCGIIRSFAKKA